MIAEHIPRLREVGQACWNATFRSKQIIEARIRAEGEPGGDLSLPRFECPDLPAVNALAARIQDETQAIWIDPPQEIVDLHRGEIPSGAGSYAQYFSMLLFVNGETRSLGYNNLNGLVRLSQKESLSLQVVCELAPMFTRTSAEFLGYCGLSTLWTFIQETLAILPQLRTKQQFTALIGSLALYANVLNTWNLQYFPWKHGSEYPARSSAFGRSPAQPAL